MGVLDDRERAAVGEIAGAAVVAAEMVWDRPHAVLAELDDGRSVVVKRPRRDRDAEEARRTFANERDCLALLGEAGAGIAPELLGSSADPELLVMEALPPGRALAALLLGDDGDATRAGMVAYAGALAAMHVSAIGREPSLPSEGPGAWAAWTARGVDPLLVAVEGLGLEVDAAAVRDECREIVAELDGPGWWRTLVHGDPCPDNTRIEAGTGRFRIFDFEHSGFGHALTDASYVVAPFPTCWCFGRVPEDVSATALAAYREVLAAAVPQAGDDRAWMDAYVVAAAAPVVSRGSVLSHSLDEDAAWGTTGHRVRLRRWVDAFLAAAEASGRFPELRRTADGLATVLAERWPDAEQPDYPGLRTGAPTVVEAPDWWSPDL